MLCPLLVVDPGRRLNRGDQSLAAMQRPITRRAVLRLAAGIPLAGAASFPAFGHAPSLTGRLIAESRTLPLISQRISFISRGLLGVRYRANTLIGGPRHREIFVVRDDA